MEHVAYKETTFERIEINEGLAENTVRRRLIIFSFFFLFWFISFFFWCNFFLFYLFPPASSPGSFGGLRLSKHAFFSTENLCGWMLICLIFSLLQQNFVSILREFELCASVCFDNIEILVVFVPICLLYSFKCAVVVAYEELLAFACFFLSSLQLLVDGFNNVL